MNMATPTAIIYSICARLQRVHETACPREPYVHESDMSASAICPWEQRAITADFWEEKNSYGKERLLPIEWFQIVSRRTFLGFSSKWLKTDRNMLFSLFSSYQNRLLYEFRWSNYNYGESFLQPQSEAGFNPGKRLACMCEIKSNLTLNNSTIPPVV